MMRSTTITLMLGAAALLARAGGTGDDAQHAVAQLFDTSVSNGAAATDVRPGIPTVTQGSADPCTFFSKAEIESAFGHPYGPPKKGSTMAGPTCMFYSPNTGTISIRAGEAVTRPQFDSLRTALGTSAEPVSGVGQTAFFWVGHLFVFNQGRQLVVSVSGEMTPKWRAALIKLGRLGAPRLGG